jgi:hypothetical protein
MYSGYWLRFSYDFVSAHAYSTVADATPLNANDFVPGFKSRAKVNDRSRGRFARKLRV